MITAEELARAIPVNIGNAQTFAKDLEFVHHDVLVQILTSKQMIIEPTELTKLYRTADLLTSYYTNPFNDERAAEIPVGSRVEMGVRQSGLMIAATIYEYLAEYTALPDVAMVASLPRHHELLLRAGLMYALGDLGPRATVLLRNLTNGINFRTLSIREPQSLSLYFSQLLVAGQLEAIRFFPNVRPDDLRDAAHSLGEAIRNGSSERPNEYFADVAALRLIEACVFAARAFLEGDVQVFEAGQRSFDAALDAADRDPNPGLAWRIGLTARVFRQYWGDSVWMRLSEVIPDRAYLRSLAATKVIILWKSQIAALEVTSQFDNVVGGYLDPRIRRVVVSMPTSSGKTLLCELAIVKALLDNPSARCIYVAPTRALRDQIVTRLQLRLAPLGIRISVPASDSESVEYESLILSDVNVVVVTQEKLLQMLRQNSPSVSEAGLFIFDEFHTIGDRERGFLYEQAVSLILSSDVGASAKLMFVSAVMPNHLDIAEWVDPSGVASSISTTWQPTRVLKGALVLVRPPLPIRDGQHKLRGDVVYVRKRDDLRRSPFIIKGVLESHQTVKRGGEPYAKRDTKASDDRGQHAALLAARYVRLGPVLVYAPTRAVMFEALIKCVEILPALDDEELTVDLRDSRDYLFDVFGRESILGRALARGVAVHHGAISRDVRDETESLFEAGLIKILISTGTLSDGVNFPIKTLIVSDTCNRRIWDREHRTWKYEYPLSLRSFLNASGRAGRALHETEGQVIIVSPMSSNMATMLDEQVNEYLNASSLDSDLAVHSALSADVIDTLEELVEAFENGTADANDVILEDKLPNAFASAKWLAKQLDALSLLPQSGTGKLVDFHAVFASSLAGAEIVNASAVLDRYTSAARSTAARAYSPEALLLFGRTGLDIATARRLYAATAEYWEMNANRDYNRDLSRDDIVAFGKVVYGIARGQLAPTELKQNIVGQGAKTALVIEEPAELLADWIAGLASNELIEKFFDKGRSEDARRMALALYEGQTLSYSTPWLLSSLVLFSRHLMRENVAFVDSRFADQLLLLPAYAKFGVSTPMAALCCTIGIGPSSVARHVSLVFQDDVPAKLHYDIPEMLAWLKRIDPEFLLERGFAGRAIRRILAKVGAISVSRRPPERIRGDVVDFAIAGLAYYDCRDVSTVAVGDKVLLKPQPYNEFDRFAIEVISSDGRKLGYVPRNLAPILRERIGDSDREADILAVTRDLNPNERIFVRFVERADGEELRR